jgi:pyruvate dehydrogenase E2 component (dihydrolipoamide acetyltransferase)
MAEFVMPTLGADMSAGTLMEWLKGPGDAVERGEIIAVVHTDKADVEVEVFTGGVVEELLVEPGQKVPVGTPLALIREEGTAAPTPTAPPRAEPGRTEPPPSEPEPSPTEAARAAAGAPPGEAARPSRLLISPSARHLAEELGLDPATIAGSGPGGRIQRSDVERAAAARTEAATPSARPAEPAAPPASARPAEPAAPVEPPRAVPRPPADERQAAMRRAIAAAMTRSKRETPHFYLETTIDMSTALRWLADDNERRSVAERLLPGVLLLKAVALALREVPELNAVWEGEQAVQKERINVGMALWLRSGGLVAPAVHDTDRLSLDELMLALRDLTARARAGSLRSSELSDPTITVTSIGERGVERLYGVIFPPQVAIVGFGKTVERPWVVHGRVLPCPVVTATLSADHRVTDGHRAALLLAAVDRLLQEPEEL